MRLLVLPRLHSGLLKFSKNFVSSRQQRTKPFAISTRRAYKETSGAGKLRFRNRSIENSTRNWFEKIVIGPSKLCPFAPPFSISAKTNNFMRIIASNACNAEEAVTQVASEVKLLFREKKTCDEEHDSHHETTLIAFDESKFRDVQKFQSFVQLSWKMQMEAVVDAGFGNDLQLVLFHPKAMHDTYSEYECENSTPDAAVYTIRSPHPTVHLLREQDVIRAVQSGYPNLDQLPTRNKAKLRRLGLEKCVENLKKCYE